MNKRVSLLLCSCLLVGGLVATGCEKAKPPEPKETTAPQDIEPADANKAADANEAPDADANVITPKADAPKADAPKADAPKADAPKAD